MRAKTSYTYQSLIICLFFNGVLAGGLYLAGQEVLNSILSWVKPMAEGEAATPEVMKASMGNLAELLNQIGGYLAIAILGAIGVVTLLMWAVLVMLGRGAISRGSQEGTVHKAAPKPKKQTAAPEKIQTSEASPGPAVQILGILQRRGRFLDFLDEDLSLYQDAQIGAAVRNIHQDCKKAVEEHVKLERVYNENEGDQVTVQESFDPQEVRLIGNVSGNPPFQGVLRHRGWRVRKITLPKVVDEKKDQWVVAPAEVEV